MNGSDSRETAGGGAVRSPGPTGIGRRDFLLRTARAAAGAAFLSGGGATRGLAYTRPSRSARNPCRCLFNHEAAIFCTFMRDRSPEDSGPRYLASFIEKLEDTDVDAVMYCPTAWRANVYPSEVDPEWRTYREGQESKWRGFDHIMKYIHGGGDPPAETLAACRQFGKDFFISYRMNDAHYITDREWPTHTSFWRDHPEYWLGDSNISATFRPEEDNVRLHNYMRPEVRDWYYAILEELCARYDTDGLELDFQRAPRFFYNREMDAGREVMTAFVGRIREMLVRIGNRRNKRLQLCVRVPETFAKCRKAGLDVAAWDRMQLVDMVNLSPYYLHTLEVDIEDFRSQLQHSRIFGEIPAHTQVTRGSWPWSDGLRYATREMYYATALNYLARGADGLSVFNYDYVPHGSPAFHDRRVERAAGLKGITDIEFLKTRPKHYVMVPYRETRLMPEFYHPVKDEARVEIVIPDNAADGSFARALLRVETADSADGLRLGAWLNGRALAGEIVDDTELFPPVLSNPHGYPAADRVKFFAVPPRDIISGKNVVESRNLDGDAESCEFRSIELALYR